MTVRHFDGVDDVITAEPLSPFFTGHGTLAALWRASDGGNHAIVCGDASGFERWGMFPIGGDEVYVDYNGFSTIQAWSPDEWYLTIATKPSGSAAVRQHSVPYSTGSWTHTNRSTINDEASASHTATHFGFSVNNNFFLEGELAVVGVWSGTELTDSECEDLEFELVNWLTVPPTGLWAFNQESVGDPVLDLSGNGFDQTAITGTSVLTGEDPPGFNFSLSEDTRFYRDGGLWVPVVRHVRQSGAWVTL